ncbi:GlsB/YeaQ/YmgE family stress response membrane protein [Demequina sp.]|uniref:GlsB/YeaQ/YmgE family stress response membrane protein n=1 Tax=Demequina sp. TaxID=2050685 RepID=UPI003A883A95
MGFWDFVGLAFAGLIVGAVARLFLKGRQDIGMCVTVLLGMAGSLAGGWIWREVFDGDDTWGVDWIAFFIGVAVAAGLIALVVAIKGGQKRRGPS